MSSRAAKKRLRNHSVVVRKGFFRGYVFSRRMAQIQKPGTNMWELAEGLTLKVYRMYFDSEYHKTMELRTFIEKLFPEGSNG